MLTHDEPSHKDFFISYNSADRLWAEWIAWQLEQEGYSAVLQNWNLQPGQSFVQSMQDATRNTRLTIAILSPDYLDDLYKETEWSRAFVSDQKNEQRILLPVQVRECRQKLKGILSLIVYIDLIGLDENEAREALLVGVSHTLSKPTAPLNFSAEKTEQPGFPASFPPIWNVPERNPFFTDREEILSQLHNAFENMDKQAHILSQAINGLGGIGKTQIAIEYAYRYRNDYQTVLWMSADSHNTLITSCLEVAHRLNLPQKDAQDQSEVMAAVQNWFCDHVNWLLIFDNADDLSIVRKFLPSVARGHVLITTRAQAMGRVAQGNTVDKMTPKEGALFLLRRARILGPGDILDSTQDEYQEAMKITQMMDGLPLALDQAGAYIEEVGCSIANYRQLYKTHRKELLQRRGSPIFDHPEPVATTWSLSFQRIQEAKPVAAELLKLCAFLSPDDIPEEIIIKGTVELGPELSTLANNPLEIDAAIAELRRYSLVLRHPENKTLSIHRLVQTVLRDTMPEEEQHLWAKRAILAVNRVFPEVKFETWKQCQRYLPHAQECEEIITKWQIELQDAADLLHRVGIYLRERAHYAYAERMLQQALTIYKRAVGADAIAVARTQSDLAKLYETQSKYIQAEQLYLEALEIFEHDQKATHYNTNAVNNLGALAKLYHIQREYHKEAAILQRALDIFEKILGESSPSIARIIKIQADLHRFQSKYEQAESLYLRALSILEQASEEANNPLDIASILNGLAHIYHSQHKYEQAEPLLQRALSIREQALGPDHPNTASSLDSLARLYLDQKKYKQAEPLLRRTLSIREQALGPDHPNTASSLDSLARLYLNQKEYEQAEPLLQRALSIREQALGSDHIFTALSLDSLAHLYQLEEKYYQAEPLYRRALDICTLRPKIFNSITPRILDHLTKLLRETQRPDEAADLERRIKVIEENDTKEYHENNEV